MNLPKDKLNKAMQITQEFGPRRSIPRDVRLRESYPDINESLISDLLQFCDNVEQKALEFAEVVQRGDLSMEIAKRELSKAFPLLDADCIKTAMDQALYFVAK